MVIIELKINANDYCLNMGFHKKTQERLLNM